MLRHKTGTIVSVNASELGDAFKGLQALGIGTGAGEERLRLRGPASEAPPEGRAAPRQQAVCTGPVILSDWGIPGFSAVRHLSRNGDGLARD
jgi:hypothetical protein